MTRHCVLWPLERSELARTSDAAVYVLRVTANSVTEDLNFPSLTASRPYWYSEDGAADSSAGNGDLVQLLHDCLVTHSELTALNTTVNLSDGNVITISVQGFDFIIRWSHANTTLNALPFGFAQSDYDADDTGGSLYRVLAPNQTYGIFRPAVEFETDTRANAQQLVRGAASLSGVQRISNLGPASAIRDLSYGLLPDANALTEYAAATEPRNTAEHLFNALAAARPCRIYPDDSSRTSTSYEDYYLRINDGEEFNGRGDLIDRDQRWKLRWTFKLPLRAVSAGEVAVIGGAAAAGSSGAPTDAQYLTLAAHADLSAERVATAGNGVTITDAGAGSTATFATTHQLALWKPPGINCNSNTASMSPTNGECYAVYLGRADRAITSLSVQYRHVTDLTGTISYAELAVATGTPTLGSGVTLTSRGSVSISGVINSGAPANHTATITLSGVAKGDELWILYGRSTTGAGGALLAGTIVDVIGAGYFQRATVRPSAVSSTAFSVETSTSIGLPWYTVQVAAP